MSTLFGIGTLFRRDVRLEDVRVADLAEVLAIESASFPVPWRRDYFLAEVGIAFRFNRVARDPSGRVVGYVFCAHAAGELHVNKIAVAPTARRQGIAKKLMDSVLEFSRNIRAEEIYLEVRVSNRPARTFYTSLGFEEAGRRPAYYLDGEDALVMVRTLERS